MTEMHCLSIAQELLGVLANLCKRLDRISLNQSVGLPGKDIIRAYSNSIVRIILGYFETTEF